MGPAFALSPYSVMSLISRTLGSPFKVLKLPARQILTRSFFIAPAHDYRPGSIAKMAQQKARVLIVGTGGVGTMSAYALEQGGKAEVTAVMRSNYEAVQKNGISIDSVQWGNGIKGWRPTHSEWHSHNTML